MKKVLLVEDTPEIMEVMVAGLENATGLFDVITATNGEEAIAVLAKHSVSTLVTDLYMPKMDGLELLAYMGKEHPKTPCIVMTAYSCQEIEDLLEKKAIFAFLEKPFDIRDLVNTVQDALFHFEQVGAIDGLSISGFLQLIEMEEKSCILEAGLTSQKSGRFYFVKGELFDAHYADLKPEKAAITMIGWDNATLRLKNLPSVAIERRIGFNLKSLIMEGARLKDETQAALTDVGPKTNGKFNSIDILYQGIKKAEACENKQAQQMLVSLLKQNPKNYKGWLWYARVMVTMKAIGTALDNARILAPDNLEIQEEIKKFQGAQRAGCPDDGQVAHCPFCWTPIIKDSEQCSYCNGKLSITKQSFDLAVKKINSDVITEAFNRYAKLTLIDRNNSKAHYYLGLAYLNLGQYEDAIEHLYTTRKLAPENETYNQQLRILLDHLASVESSTPVIVEKKSARKKQKDDGAAKKILVAEDSATTRKVITLMLQQEGYEVIAAKDGIEALAKFNDERPDLVLLDIIMPGMDGYQVLSALKKNKDFKDIPVIMLTAKDTLIDKIKGKMSASNEYLTKPFKSEELMAKINKYFPRP